MKKWVLAIVIILIIIGLGVGIYIWRQNTKSQPIDSGSLPQFIQADFIDIDKIFSISKFRSGSGHDFSGNGEKCRSMKHYYAPQWSQEGERLRQANNGTPPAPDGKTDIDIFSPVDGIITGIQSEKTPIGEQIYIQPSAHKDYTVRLFHIYKNAGISKGTKVTAGEKIGVISGYSMTDIAVQRGRNYFISYFDVLPDSIFAKYQARGVTNRSDIIISKQQRDANPLQCNGEQFANQNNNQNSEDYVFLSGYLGGDMQNQSSVGNQNNSNQNNYQSGNSSEVQNNNSAPGSGGGNGTGGGNRQGNR